MESTGIYWVPIFELLEQCGIKPYLVNARHVKTVPGRKSDWNDAQWLQKLHALGLLQASFRPGAVMCVLRTLLRHRAQLVDLLAVTGLSASLAQTILSEVSTDMSHFPTVKHFCSWLGLAPPP